MAEKSVIVAAHGNSLRALMMVLDRMSTDEITGLNLGTGIPIVYELNADTTVKTKTILDK